MADAEGRASRPGEPSGNVAPSGSPGTARPTSVSPARKPLGHAVPAWVEDGAMFFITVCAHDRRPATPLLRAGLAKQLIDSVAYLHRESSWYAHLFLVMPDHVHGLIAVPSDSAIGAKVSAWKRYTNRAFGVVWQERFFDHRIRSNESLDEKAGYIRNNPVRAGLVRTADEWPHVWDVVRRPEGWASRPGEPSGNVAPSGSPGTARPTSQHPNR